MDEIRRAVEKAKSVPPPPAPDYSPSRRKSDTADARHTASAVESHIMAVNRPLLEDSRIVAHLGDNPASMSFDLLRTRVIQFMRANDFKSLVVTSPSPGCGKTVTAINLALSMARQVDLHTVLVDLDLRKPQVSNYLGVRTEHDVYSVLNGRADLADAMFTLDIAGPRLSVLTTSTPSRRPAETVASPKMRELVEKLERLNSDTIVIVDMPPILLSDDVISFLPSADAVLLVVAAGQTTDREVQDALRLIPDTKLIGSVLTKSDERADNEYYKYY